MPLVWSAVTMAATAISLWRPLGVIRLGRRGPRWARWLSSLSLLLASACADGVGPFPEQEAASRDLMRDGRIRKNTASYIITLEPKANAHEVAREYGISPDQVYTSVLHGFAGHISDVARSGLMKDLRVRRVEANATVSISGAQEAPPWGLDRIDQRSGDLDGRYEYTTGGAGVTVYIVDTGLRYDHAEFGGRARPGYSYFFGDGSDCHGHGTHVAGIVGGRTFGVAKEVDLVSVAVLTCYGTGSLDGVIAGLDWIAANAERPAVVNMSLGGGASESLDEAVRNLVATGVTVVAAAGNANSDACGVSPAREPQAITVGATDPADRRTSWSNWGPCLDLFAPGVSIESATHVDNVGSVFMSGTSMAAPHAAGAAALFLQQSPGSSPAEVEEGLRGSATRDAVSDARGSPAHLIFTGGPVSSPANAPPNPQFAALCTALMCSFTDTSTDPDGSVVAWAWDFGDGSSSTAPNPEHEFTAAGTYRVRLAVTDDNGAPAYIERSITVNSGGENSPPEAAFEATCSGLLCEFKDRSSDVDGKIVRWVWDFGDGSTLTSQASTHVFPGPGAYRVTLTVTDDAGATDEKSEQVTVSIPNQAPVSSFEVECAAETCQFTDLSRDADGTIVSRHWDFGDGSTSAHVNPTHSYAGPGMYAVSLTVADAEGATAWSSTEITIAAPAPIVLVSRTYKVKGAHHVDLTWTGAAGGHVALYRNAELLRVVPNTGAYTDIPGTKGRGDFVYRLCEVGGTVCSADLPVSF